MSGDVEKREPFCTVGENVNWCSHHGKQYVGSSKKSKLELACDLAIPCLGICLKERKSLSHSHGHCSIVRNGQGVEIISVSSSG